MALLAMVPACGFQSSAAHDGGDDSGTPNGPRCFGSFVTVCFTTLADVPTKSVMVLDDLPIDTGSWSMCDQHNDQMTKYCVVAGTSFTLSPSKTIRAYGSKPLVLLSTSTMTLPALSTVDVSSNRLNDSTDPKAKGAGANPAACATNAGTPPEMAGGGYGGSFGGKGGDGERLSGAQATSGIAAAALSAPPTLLRGGCSGGNGDNTGGAGGSGGGVVALIATTSILLDGTINASGAGGHGSPATKSGGGGGGSGGMIVLDSPSITGTAGTGPLFANGGSGGQGGTGGGAPATGDDGTEPAAPSTAATGGNNTTGRDGGSGGTGSSGTRLIGTNAGNTPAGPNGGGGGGGGGAGFIRAHGIAVNIAPPSFVQ
jgi:hypothetical protein